MEKHAWWAWAIKNSIAVLTWASLAIIFGIWWIALFGLLFLNGFTTKEIQKHYRVCDKCGKRSPYANNYNEALDKAKEADWLHIVNGNKDYCPDCKEWSHEDV